MELITILYNKSQKGVKFVDERLVDFYHLSEIETFEDVHLQTLRENCAVLEESVRDMLQRLPDADCQILEAYMDMRDELEFQTVKTALRWGKKHYK